MNIFAVRIVCKYAQCKIFWGWLLRIPPPSRSNLESVMCSSNTPPLCRCRARTGNRPPTCHEIWNHTNGWSYAGNDGGLCSSWAILCAKIFALPRQSFKFITGLSLLCSCLSRKNINHLHMHHMFNLYSFYPYIFVLLTAAPLSCLSAILHDEPSYNWYDFLLLCAWWW